MAGAGDDRRQADLRGEEAARAQAGGGRGAGLRAPVGGLRLDQFLVASGVAESRRRARELIRRGRVRVNGRRVTRPWWLVFEGDEVRVGDTVLRVVLDDGDR
ncbi:MAG: S4 domain-containing protein [Euryarchaeota archaeon]